MTSQHLSTYQLGMRIFHCSRSETTHHILFTTADARKPNRLVKPIFILASWLSNSPEGKTIVPLDLQLYSKCIQLQSRQDISPNFVFRMGELDVVFAFLKAIGKLINNSGLDTAFTEAGIYGPTTVEKIKSGKHMKRSFEPYDYVHNKKKTIL